MKFVIPIENRFHWDTIPRNRDLGLTINNHCNVPSRRLLVDWKGDCFVCSCELWLPISVGKITDFQRLEDVWASPAAQAIQQDINEKKFSNCAVNNCGITQYNIIEEVYTVSINIDESCNLACPSCRKGPVMITSGERYEEKLAWSEHLVDMLEKFDHPTRIIISGNGDPLASAVMRPLLHRYRPRHNHWIKLFTNGLLLRKQLTDNPVMAHVNEYLISIDAGSKDVYEKVRLGGRWSQLIDNFYFLKQYVPKSNNGTHFNISLTLVVQKDNYKDIQNFCELCKNFKFLGTITSLENWNTWGDFDQQDVLNPAHPEHSAAVESLSSAYQRFPKDIFFSSKIQQLLGITQSVS